MIEKKMIEKNVREEMQCQHLRSLGVLAEMQRTFKPEKSGEIRGKVLTALVERVERQIVETDVIVNKEEK